MARIACVLLFPVRDRQGVEMMLLPKSEVDISEIRSLHVVPDVGAVLLVPRGTLEVRDWSQD